MAPLLTLAGIPAGAAVFLDANTFLYSFSNHPVLGPACTAFLERIDRNEVQGYTSADVLGEVAHRMMTIEACDVFGWPPQGIANRLRRHPAEVRRLNRYRHALDEVGNLRIQVLPVTGALVSRAADLCRQFGLLSADALIVAVMLDAGLSFLASNDADFDNVPGLTRYAPA